MKIKRTFHLIREAIKHALRPGVIVGALPNNIQNGQVEDAVPLMANYNWIVNQVNANAAQLSLTPQLASANVFTALQSGIAAVNPANFPIFSQVGLVPISTDTGGGATYEFKNLTGYAGYLFILDNVIPAAAGSFGVQVSDDNGATYKTAANYANAVLGYTTAAAAANYGGAADARILLCNANNVSNVNPGVSGWFLLPNPVGGAGLYVFAQSQVSFSDGVNYNVASGVGAWTGGFISIDAVRFISAAGAITSGNIRCYGLRS